MKLSKVFRKLLSIHMVICLLLTGYYVISNLMSNFESTKDWIFYFVMPFYLTDNLLPDSRMPFAFVVVIIGFVLFSILAICAFVNQAYVIFISSLGWIIPCFLYGVIYIMEEGKSDVE